MADRVPIKKKEEDPVEVTATEVVPAIKPAKPVKSEAKPESFAMPLKEFLAHLKAAPELKEAFSRIMSRTGEASKRLAQDQWQARFDLFKTKPVGTTYEAWAAKGGV